QRQHARKEILAARREEISVRPLALLAALHENLVVDQTRKPGRQGLTRDAETALELLETVHAEERFADDQEGPAVEHDLDRLAHGTVPLHAAVRQGGMSVHHFFNPTPAAPASLSSW